jgi:tetratricopeptide (TPR) repeat protein
VDDRSTPWQLFMRQRGLVVLLILAALLTLSPSPIPQGARDSLLAAGQFIQANDPVRAADALAQFLAIAPWAPTVRQRAIELALAGGDGRLASELIDAAGPAELSGVECLRARTLSLGDEPRLAYDPIVDASPGCPLAPAAIDRLADLALRDGDPALAADLQAIRRSLEPDSPEAQLDLGRALAVSEPHSALAPLRQSIELAHSAPPIAVDLIRAIEDSQTEDDPAFAFAQVGQAFARHGEWQSARLALDRALQIEPEYTEARAYQGLAMDRLGLDGGPALQAAAKAAPGAAIPASLLGLHLLESERADEALPLLAKAAALRPEDPAFAAQHAAALAATGDLQSALTEYEHATALAPEEPAFWTLLTEFCLANRVDPAGDCSQAARTAYLLAPTAANTSNLGYAHLLAGDLAVAERMLRHASLLDPASARNHYRLGLLALGRGQSAAARTWLLAAIELDPSGPIGELSQRTLDRIGR